MILNRTLEHPDITYARLTGYPQKYECDPYCCELCFKQLDDDEAYEDENYDYLCRDCLLELHSKGKVIV